MCLLEIFLISVTDGLLALEVRRKAEKFRLAAQRPQPRLPEMEDAVGREPELFVLVLAGPVTPGVALREFPPLTGPPCTHQ